MHTINSERIKKQVAQGLMPSHARIEWNSAHQDILKGLVHYLINPPLMAYPDFTKPFVLHTDASELGLRAVLYQRQEGHLRVFAYASCPLTTAEKS